jgi:hypothetical protein
LDMEKTQVVRRGCQPSEKKNQGTNLYPTPLML